MTHEDATTVAGFIHAAFPNIDPKPYVRALVHYDAKVASEAIIRSIERDWKYPPSVFEMAQSIRARMPHMALHCDVCKDDKLVFVGTREWHGQDYDQYARCPSCQPPDTDYHGHKALTQDQVRDLMNS